MPPSVKRTPVAALVFSDVPLSSPLRATLERLAGARAIDLEVHGATLVVGARGAHLSRRAASLRMTARWLSGPRASRPRVLIGIGEGGGEVAVRIGRALGIRSVVWTGALCGDVPKPILQGADDVWGLDDAAVRRAAGIGRRAYRALLAPALEDVALAGPPEIPGRLAVLGPVSAQHVLVDAIARGGRGMEVAILGPETPELFRAWPEIRLRFVDVYDDQARQAQITWACGVLAPDPEAQHAWLTEALLLGRPILVPKHRQPPVFSRKVGFSYNPDRSESLSDALAELWSATERNLFDRPHLRSLGASMALDVLIEELIARILIGGSPL